MGTHVFHAITVTRFMQPMPILTLSSSKHAWSRCWAQIYVFRPAHMYINTNFLQRRGYMVPWPLPHKMLNPASIPQSLSITCTTELSASQHSYRTWISRARAI